MSFSVAATLQEIRAEIARLQKLERTLAEAAESEDTGLTKSRISPAGAAVISLAAQLRHAKRSGDKATIRRLEKELKAAKAAKAKA